MCAPTAEAASAQQPTTCQGVRPISCLLSEALRRAAGGCGAAALNSRPPTTMMTCTYKAL